MPSPVRFAYPRMQFLVRTLSLTALLVCILLFTLTFADTLFWLSVFIVIFLLMIVLTNLTPLFTVHEVGEEGVTLRQGILFSTHIPFSDIETVERRTEPLWRFGIIRSRMRGRIVLASGNGGLVTITLKSRRRFRSLLFRSGSEIVIDLIRPEGFLGLVSERLAKVSLSPVDAHGPGPELRDQA